MVKLKKSLTILSIFFAVQIFSNEVIHPYMPVTEDYVKAKELSKDYHLPMVLVFMGSDWDHNTKKLNQNLIVL